MTLATPRAFAQAFRSLRTRNYRLFWFGQLISLTGTWMQDTALSWLVLTLTTDSSKAAVALGTTMAVRFLPILLFSLPSGVLADRQRKRRVLIATQSTQMVVALALGLLTSTGYITVSIIYGLAALRGLLDAIDGPTRQSFVQEMVGDEDLPNAVALNATLFNGCRMFGPVVAAVVIKLVGMAACFYINTASFVAVVAALMMMRTSELHLMPRAPRERIWLQLREGLRYARLTPQVMIIFMVMGFLGTFGYNFQTTIPLIAKIQWDGTATTLAVLLAFSGAGSVLAGLVAAYRAGPSQKLLLGSAVCFVVLLELIGISPWHWATMALLLVVGFTGVICMTSANTLLQLGVPPHLRGRVMGIYQLLFVGTTPIGSYLAGQLAAHLGGGGGLGVQEMILVTAGLTGVGVLAALIYSLRDRGAGAGLENVGEAA
jgi:MFS family permease